MALRVLVLLSLGALAAAQTGTSFPNPYLPTSWVLRGNLEDTNAEFTPKPVEQVVVAPSDNFGTAYWFIWTQNVTTCNPAVFISTDEDTITSTCVATGKRYTYLDYTSGVIYKANCTGFQWGTRYYYRIVNDLTWAPFYGTFETAPAPAGLTTFTVTGSMGTTVWALANLQRMAQTGGKAMLYVGDFAYSNGYQPRWDFFQRMFSNYVRHLPLIFCYGDQDMDGRFTFGRAGTDFDYNGYYVINQRLSGAAGASSAVFAGPNRVDGDLFYSTNYGAAHIVSINHYFAATRFNMQYFWLLDDLTKVDRTKTPWIIVLIHAPFYNSFATRYLQGETQRVQLEPLFRRFGVDIVFSGHTQAYERFDNVYQYRKDNCGPVYINTGNGGRGSIAGTDGRTYLSEPYTLPPGTTTISVLPRQDPKLYMTSAQPSISLYREFTQGHGTLQLLSATTAEWKYFNTIGTLCVDKPTDSVIINSHINSNGVYGVTQCQRNVTLPVGANSVYTLPFADGSANSWAAVGVAD